MNPEKPKKKSKKKKVEEVHSDSSDSKMKNQRKFFQMMLMFVHNVLFLQSL